MKFIIKNITKTDQVDYLRVRIAICAARYVRVADFGSTEYKLNNYLKKTYGYGLRECCKSIINSIDILINSERDFVVLIKDKNLDDLASFITYGNGLYEGSPILRNAFDLS